MRSTKSYLIITTACSLLLVGCKNDEASTSDGGEEGNPKLEKSSAAKPAAKKETPEPVSEEESAPVPETPTVKVPDPAPPVPTPAQPAVEATPEELDALERLAILAEGGDAEAQLKLGDHYANAGDHRDPVEAAKLYRAAALQGEPGAAYNLGMMYDSGDGVIKDPEEAKKWFEMSEKNSKSAPPIKPLAE